MLQSINSSVPYSRSRESDKSERIDNVGRRSLTWYVIQRASSCKRISGQWNYRVSTILWRSAKDDVILNTSFRRTLLCGAWMWLMWFPRYCVPADTILSITSKMYEFETDNVVTMTTWLRVTFMRVSRIQYWKRYLRKTKWKPRGLLKAETELIHAIRGFSDSDTLMVVYIIVYVYLSVPMLQ